MLTKFPVTAPDGTEYRVRIKEREGLCETSAVVSLYVKRKRFGFRKVSHEWYESGSKDNVYNKNNPDFIAIVNRAIHDYYADIEWSAQYQRKQAEKELRRAQALEQFAAWDGKVAEVNAE
jgi:hypothetical protein